MTDLAAWIASKRAASEGATEGPWIVERSDNGPPFAVVAPAGEAEHGTYSVARGVWWPVNARHIAAFPPAVTRRLLDAVEALDMLRREGKAYGGTSPAAEAAADAALDALRGGDHG